MINLSKEDSKLLKEMAGEISKEQLSENWRRFMEITPHSLRQPGRRKGRPIH